MKTYTISTECGVLDIEDSSIESAKEQYDARIGFDFDNYADYPGSWYWIAVGDERIEDHSEALAEVSK